MSRAIVAVTGEIPAEQLGATLAHEHLHLDVSIVSGKADNRMMAPDQMIQEMRWYLQAGGRSIIEVTPEGIGRDPLALKRIGEASGVQVISGIAFYDESTYPAWVREASVGQIADYLVRHLEEGEQGIRAGILGEVTSHNEPQPNQRGYRLHDLERRVFEAAAAAQRRTGAAITTHASLGRGGHAQLDVLEQAGADLARVVIGHCDAHWHEHPEKDMEYYLPILERGAYCQFDLIGWSELAPDDIRADRLAALVELGYADRLLLATDTCRLSQMRCNGGRGFDFIWTSFLPKLRQRGVSQQQIDCMLVEAPRRLLTRPV